MQKIIIFLVLSLFSISLFAQKYNLQPLLNVYNSNSLTKALIKLNSIKDFKGDINVDNITKKKKIIGTVGKDSIVAISLKEKTKLEIVFVDKSTFEHLLEQAKQNLHFNNDYKRGSKDISRHTYSFSMKGSDLWFNLAECYRDENVFFYELELTTYPKD
jgi:hypothetical protein